MGNCCDGGGGTAIGGADFPPVDGLNDAVDYFLTSNGHHGLFSQIEVRHPLLILFSISQSYV